MSIRNQSHLLRPNAYAGVPVEQRPLFAGPRRPPQQPASRPVELPVVPEQTEALPGPDTRQHGQQPQTLSFQACTSSSRRELIFSILRFIVFWILSVGAIRTYWSVSVAPSTDTSTLERAASFVNWILSTTICRLSYWTIGFIYLVLPVVWINGEKLLAGYPYNPSASYYVPEFPRWYRAFLRSTLDITQTIFKQVSYYTIYVVKSLAKHFIHDVAMDVNSVVVYLVNQGEQLLTGRFRRVLHTPIQTLMPGSSAVRIRRIIWHNIPGRLFLWFVVVGLSYIPIYLYSETVAVTPGFPSATTTLTTALQFTPTSDPWFATSYTFDVTTSTDQIIAASRSHQSSLDKIAAAVEPDPYHIEQEQHAIDIGKAWNSVSSVDNLHLEHAAAHHAEAVATTIHRHAYSHSHAVPSRSETPHNIPHSHSRDPMVGLDLADYSAEQIAEMRGPVRLRTWGYIQSILNGGEIAYCGLCKQQHGAEVMIAQKEFVYEWQL